MERKAGRENFVKRNKLNIAASAVAAISIAAGAHAVQERDSFDPIADSVDTANHLVLKSPHKAYEQLIAKLPKVEKAEAAPPIANVVYPSPNPDVANNCETSRKIDFYPHSKTMYVGDQLTFIVDVCLPQQGHQVRLVESDDGSDDTLETAEVYITFDSARITYYVDCVDGGSTYPNKVVGHTSYSQDAGGGAQLGIEVDGSWTNEYDNVGAETGAAQISCLDCVTQQGNVAEVEVSATCDVSSVGGVAEFPEISPQDVTLEKNRDYTIPVAAGVAAAATAVTAAGTAFYLHKRRSVKQ